MNYYIQPIWDLSLGIVFTLGTITPGSPVNGLVYYAVKVTAGAPNAIANRYVPGAKVTVVDGTEYRMTGTTASPAFSLVPTSTSAFSLPSTETDSTSTTGTSVAWAFSSITSGIAQSLTALATTSGKIYRAVAAAATLTTGRYFEAFDGTTNVWGIGANGHIHTAQTTAPTIAMTTQNGITAAAITAGGSDTAGQITTTGTNDNVGPSILQITFNKTFTVAPKAVILQPLNASAALAVAASGAGVFVSAITATTFDITIPADAAAGATPSFAYLVIA